MPFNQTTANLRHRISELEKELELTGSCLKSFFGWSPVGFILFDLNLRYTRLNETIANIAGVSVEQLLGKKPSEILPQPLANYIEDQLKKVIATSAPLPHDPFSCILPDQPDLVRHWVASHFPLQSDQGEIYGVGVVVVEVTNLHQAMASLSKQEEFYRTLLESLPARIFIKDCSGKYLYCNNFFANDVGLSPAEITGKTDFDLFRSEKALRYSQADQEIITTGLTKEFEYQFEMNGRDYYIRVRKTPVRDGKGNIIGILGIFHDLTEEKQTERLLRIADHVLAATLAGIAIFDPDWNLTYVNEAFLSMWGYDQEGEVLGRPASEFWATPETALEVINELHDKGDWQGEMVGLKKDGTTIHTLLAANLVDDDNRQPLCMIGSFIDITERKAAEQKLWDSEEQLRQISDHIDDALWIIDTNKNQILYASPACEKVWGVSNESLFRNPEA